MPDTKYEKWSPTYECRVVAPDDLSAFLSSIPRPEVVSLTWNDLRDKVLMVNVGPDYSTVTKLEEDTFSDLVLSEDDEPWGVVLGGTASHMPRGAKLPRELGLAVLLKAERSFDLLREYTWRVQ